MFRPEYLMLAIGVICTAIVSFNLIQISKMLTHITELIIKTHP